LQEFDPPGALEINGFSVSHTHINHRAATTIEKPATSQPTRKKVLRKEERKSCYMAYSQTNA
jgi:hypothetical protein